jgi:hypothetical protein
MRMGQLHKEEKKLKVQLSVNQTLKDKLEKINLKKTKKSYSSQYAKFTA